MTLLVYVEVAKPLFYIMVNVKLKVMCFVQNIARPGPYRLCYPQTTWKQWVLSCCLASTSCGQVGMLLFAHFSVLVLIVIVVVLFFYCFRSVYLSNSVHFPGMDSLQFLAVRLYNKKDFSLAWKNNYEWPFVHVKNFTTGVSMQVHAVRGQGVNLGRRLAPC